MKVGMMYLRPDKGEEGVGAVDGTGAGRPTAAPMSARESGSVIVAQVAAQPQNKFECIFAMQGSTTQYR